MKDQWYADNKDLVKWGVLWHLAIQHGTHKIIHAAYYRPCNWGSLVLDGQQYPLPAPVIAHFRDVHNITKMTAQPQIDVIGTVFANRGQYTHGIIAAIGAIGANPCIVFLDPDTGLESGKPGLEHVLDSELNAVWNAVRTGDVLALFQHQTNRNGKPWIEPKREQFEDALGLQRGTAKIAKGPDIDSEVVLFYCQKGT